MNDGNFNALKVALQFYADSRHYKPVIQDAFLPCPLCGGVCDGPHNYGDVPVGGWPVYDQAPNNQVRRAISCIDCGLMLTRLNPEGIPCADFDLHEAWNKRTLVGTTIGTDLGVLATAVLPLLTVTKSD